MNKKTLIYHGSPEIIRNPVYGGGRLHNDYGRGFYCTENQELAGEWACTALRDGFINSYEIDLSKMKILNLSDENLSVLNWMSVLVQNRIFSLETPVAGRAKKYLIDHFSLNINAYDVIVGYRADDAYYSYADLFLNNGITVVQLAKALRLGKLGDQIVLKTRWAFDNLSFTGFEPADSETYYPLRKARNDNAEAEFWELSKEIDDGLYMSDIIKEGLGNDDARIPRNVSSKSDD